MSERHLILFSVPGLRPSDVTRENAPTLWAWANRGAMAELAPTFPCVTSPVQASMWTGRPPGEHGVIANGFYHRERNEVEFWVGRNGVIHGEQVWDALHRRGISSAVWHAQNIKDAAADFIVTPAPIHEPDGATKLWCYSKPDGLYQRMLDDGLGHFPLHRYWGPMANIESTQWILKAALWLIQQHQPRFHWIYLPHLDYAGQKFGPNSPQAQAALKELDGELANFAHGLRAISATADHEFLVAGEYAMTDVRGVVYPNRLLRQAGLLAVKEDSAAEQVDLPNSSAFAMVDHQLAHVYVRPFGGGKEQDSRIAKVAELFHGVKGIAAVYAGEERSRIGLAHQRAGEVILVCEDHWLAYYWWLEDAAAPAYARTVDIHRKPGYDPVELFFDPATKSIPLDAKLVKGSHGVPATEPRHRTALIHSGGRIDPDRIYRDTDVKALGLAC